MAGGAEVPGGGIEGRVGRLSGLAGRCAGAGKPLHWLRLGGVALLYYGAARLGLEYAVVGSTVTLVWLPSGIALACLLAWGCPMAAGVWLGAFLANAGTGLAPLLAASIALGNTLAALAGALALQHGAGFRAALDRRRDVFALIFLAAMGATLLSAGVGAATLVLGEEASGEPYAAVALKWWLGDMMGVLVAAPPLLLLLQRRPRWALPRGGELLLLLALLLAVAYPVFMTPDQGGRGYYQASLAVFPFVIWGALRFEQWGAALVTLVISLVAIWGTTLGSGPFAVGLPVESLMRWCAFVNVVAVTGLLLAASRAEQHQAQAALQHSLDELERRVRDRTRELDRMNRGLEQEMAERKRLEARLIRVGEAQYRALGQELHDGLGQQLTSIAFFGASLQQQLEARQLPEAAMAARIVDLLNQAIHSVRGLARGMYPVALETAGLPAALAQLAENTRHLAGMECELNVAPDLALGDPLVAINLYRVAQEAITNAVKYSQARRLRIALMVEQESCRLSVADDGIGFDPRKMEEAPGLGLHSLRDRARLLGGSFCLSRNPEGGTTVSVAYPLVRRIP